MDASTAVTPPQLCPAWQTLQHLANNLHVVADHVPGAPLYPYHAAFTGSEEYLHFYAVVGCDQPMADLISVTGIRFNGLLAV
jgi:hypothetical protein